MTFPSTSIRTPALLPFISRTSRLILGLRFPAFLLCFVLIHSLAQAAPLPSAAIREAAEFILRRGGQEAAEHSLPAVSRQIERLVARYGDEALQATRTAGFRTFPLVDDAGAHGGHVIQLLARYGEDGIRIAREPRALSLFVRHGDDGVRAMLRHPGVAEPLIRNLDGPGLQALNAISSRNGRRLAMMADSGQLQAIGRSSEVLGVVARHGDRGMNFIWRHKGALAVSSVLGAFLLNPEPFLDGTKELAGIAGENVAKPLVKLPGIIAANMDWTWPITIGGGLLLLYICAKLFLARLLSFIPRLLIPRRK